MTDYELAKLKEQHDVLLEACEIGLERLVQLGEQGIPVGGEVLEGLETAIAKAREQGEAARVTWYNRTGYGATRHKEATDGHDQAEYRDKSNAAKRTA